MFTKQLKWVIYPDTIPGNVYKDTIPDEFYGIWKPSNRRIELIPHANQRVSFMVKFVDDCVAHVDVNAMSYEMQRDIPLISRTFFPDQSSEYYFHILNLVRGTNEECEKTLIHKLFRHYVLDMPAVSEKQLSCYNDKLLRLESKDDLYKKLFSQEVRDRYGI